MASAGKHVTPVTQASLGGSASTGNWLEIFQRIQYIYDMRRFYYMFAMLLAASISNTAAQEQEQPSVPHSRESLLSHEQRLLLAFPSEFVLLGFRRYELDLLQASEHSALGPAVLRSAENQDASLADISSLSSTVSLSIPLGGDAVQLPAFQQVGRFVLMEALRFGYQYFRESTRKSSLKEMDYLELPQGNGVFRTTGEVQDAALERGEVQSLRVHEDRKAREKNAVKEAR